VGENPENPGFYLALTARIFFGVSYLRFVFSLADPENKPTPEKSRKRS
jgi:hypothetical protein